MAKARFEWNSEKDEKSQRKHGVSFATAQFAFADPNRIIAEDLSHSKVEKRFYCFGKIESRVLTVRFTYRRGVIRIFGAGYWRKGRSIYEQESQIHKRAARKTQDHS